MKEQIKLIVQSVFEVDNFVVPHRQMKERVARQVYAYLLTNHTKMKPLEIAYEIGRDRASVYASCKVVKETLLISSYREDIEKCVRMVLNNDSRFIINCYYWFRYFRDEVWSTWYIAKFDGIIDYKYIWRINGSIVLSVGSNEFESDGEIKHD